MRVGLGTNLLDKARMLREIRERQLEFDNAATRTMKYKSALLEVNRFYNVLLSEVREVFYNNTDTFPSAYEFEIDGLYLRVSYEKRGYDNLGASYGWYHFVKVGKGRWKEIRSLVDLVNMVDLFGICGEE